MAKLDIIDELNSSEIEQELEELETWGIAQPTYSEEELSDQMYDEAGDRDHLYDNPLNEGLTEEEVKDAKLLESAGLLRGIMLVTGQAGCGKGLFSNTLAWKLRRYFKNRRVLMDYRPRKVFDMYAPPDNKYFLFNSEFMMSQLRAMAIGSGVEITKEDSDKVLKGKKLKAAVDDTGMVAKEWVARNEVMLVGAIMLLDEFKRYFHNRRPHNPYGVLLGHVINVWRHLDLLMIGMAQLRREIDAISCLPHVTHHVKCSWNGRHNSTTARVFRISHTGKDGVWAVSGRPFKIIVDGGKPRAQLGGYRYYDLYPSKNLHNLMPTTNGGVSF